MATGITVLATTFEPGQPAYVLPPRPAQPVALTAASDCPAAAPDAPQTLPLMPTTPVPSRGVVTPTETPGSPVETTGGDKESNAAAVGLHRGTTSLLAVVGGVLLAGFGIYIQ